MNLRNGIRKREFSLSMSEMPWGQQGRLGINCFWPNSTRSSWLFDFFVLRQWVSYFSFISTFLARVLFSLMFLGWEPKNWSSNHYLCPFPFIKLEKEECNPSSKGSDFLPITARVLKSFQAKIVCLQYLLFLFIKNLRERNIPWVTEICLTSLKLKSRN